MYLLQEVVFKIQKYLPEKEQNIRYTKVLRKVYRNSMAKMYQSGNMLKDMAHYLIRTQEMN